MARYGREFRNRYNLDRGPADRDYGWEYRPVGYRRGNAPRRADGPNDEGWTSREDRSGGTQFRRREPHDPAAGNDTHAVHGAPVWFGGYGGQGMEEAYMRRYLGRRGRGRYDRDYPLRRYDRDW